MNRKPPKRNAKPSQTGKGKNTWADHYTRQAKKDDYPARSVYKLKEIQTKFTLIKKNDSVLDLGCSPGSWLLYAAEITGPDGRVTGVDLNPVTVSLPPQARAFEGDILDLDQTLTGQFSGGFHVVMSDMAPSTTGQKDVDAARSLELCEMALDMAIRYLFPGGAFVCKIFQGPDMKAFSDRVRAVFETTKQFKPESCRKQSKEIYIIAKGKK